MNYLLLRWLSPCYLRDNCYQVDAATRGNLDGIELGGVVVEGRPYLSNPGPKAQ